MKDETIKHLEFIQTNIARMGQNSFQMKGWALTLVTALLALFAASAGDSGVGNNLFIFIGILPATIFWFLDAYYLQQERKFRGIYEDVVGLTEANKRINVQPFEMPLDKYKKGKYCICRTAFSKTVWPLYIPIILILVILGCVLSC